MSAKKFYTIEEFETKYHEVTKLYDLAEELLSTAESELVSNASAQLDIVEPLIHEIGEATDDLAEEFILIAESYKLKSPGKSNKTPSKSRVEASLRKIFASLNEYETRVRDISKKAQGVISNIADPIIAKIHRQVEEIVVIFLEFLQLSLQSIMGKAELETFKVRDARVALMMHQHAMAQQQ